jgi:hypothetical protein
MTPPPHRRGYARSWASRGPPWAGCARPKSFMRCHPAEYISCLVVLSTVQAVRARAYTGARGKNLENDLTGRAGGSTGVFRSEGELDTPNSSISPTTRVSSSPLPSGTPPPVGGALAGDERARPAAGVAEGEAATTSAGARLSALNNTLAIVRIFDALSTLSGDGHSMTDSPVARPGMAGARSPGRVCHFKSADIHMNAQYQLCPCASLSTFSGGLEMGT